MRVVYVTHSGVAVRQALFARELRRQLREVGGDLFEVYPRDWGPHHREGGYDGQHTGDLVRWSPSAKAWADVRAWSPDVFLVQNEAYCRVAKDVQRVAESLNKSYVTFSWENNMNVRYEADAQQVLIHARARVYGNRASQRLSREHGIPHDHDFILPQVGFDAGLFQPGSQEKTWDVVFMGRNGDPMKGEVVLDHAVQGKGWRVGKGYQLGFAKYEDLRDRYLSACCLCTPSRDVDGLPREQFAPGVNVEALFCGVPVVTTDQEAILEWLTSAPGVYFARQGDALSLRGKLEACLAGSVDASEVRAWAVAKFSNEVVAREWLQVLKRACT